MSTNTATLCYKLLLWISSLTVIVAVAVSLIESSSEIMMVSSHPVYLPKQYVASNSQDAFKR